MSDHIQRPSISSESDGPMPWAALLGFWSDVARSAIALPEEGEGGRYRKAVTPAIGLQAVACALRDMERLDDPADRAPAQDKAELLIRGHASEMHEIWRAEPMPELVTELIEDALIALAFSRSEGLEWGVTEAAAWPHPGDLVAALLSIGFEGDLYLPSPGQPLFSTCPASFVRARAGGVPDLDCVALIASFLGDDVGDPMTVPVMRQAYRQFDFAQGGPVRDFVAPMNDDLPAGQPLLVPAILEGESCPVSLPPRGPVMIEPLPVEFSEELEVEDEGES